MPRKDKKQVIGEHFDDERIRSFLDFPGPKDINRDFFLLEKAYRGMHEDNFPTFVTFFVQAGHDLNAPGPDGRTFLQTIREHRLAGDYIRALEDAGAH